MASLNDNLFTTLVNHASPQEIGCQVLTQWGLVTVCFTNAGISELYFNEPSIEEPLCDSIFRDVLLKWLSDFQRRTPDEQWDYLAPKGTEFQKSVWRELLNVPCGTVASYQDIAKKIGHPKANQAVGNAVGANPISLIIPCHRIVQSSGKTGNYRWGADRKQALLDAEQANNADLLSLFI